MWSFLFISNHLQASGWELASAPYLFTALPWSYLADTERIEGTPRTSRTAH